MQGKISQTQKARTIKKTLVSWLHQNLKLLLLERQLLRNEIQAINWEKISDKGLVFKLIKNSYNWIRKQQPNKLMSKRHEQILCKRYTTRQ